MQSGVSQHCVLLQSSCPWSGPATVLLDHCRWRHIYRQLYSAWVGDPGRETSYTVTETVPTNHEQLQSSTQLNFIMTHLQLNS